jgi:hypothetical protein
LHRFVASCSCSMQQDGKLLASPIENLCLLDHVLCAHDFRS